MKGAFQPPFSLSAMPVWAAGKGYSVVRVRQRVVFVFALLTHAK